MNAKLLYFFLALDCIAIGMYPADLELKSAAQEGDLKTMSKILSGEGNFTPQAMSNVMFTAAVNGNAEAVKLLRRYNTWYDKENILKRAIDYGHFAVVNALIDPNLLNSKDSYAYKLALFKPNEIEDAYNYAKKIGKTEIAESLKKALEPQSIPVHLFINSSGAPVDVTFYSSKGSPEIIHFGAIIVPGEGLLKEKYMTSKGVDIHTKKGTFQIRMVGDRLITAQTSPDVKIVDNSPLFNLTGIPRILIGQSGEIAVIDKSYRNK